MCFMTNINFISIDTCFKKLISLNQNKGEEKVEKKEEKEEEGEETLDVISWV